MFFTRDKTLKDGNHPMHVFIQNTRVCLYSDSSVCVCARVCARARVLCVCVCVCVCV